MDNQRDYLVRRIQNRLRIRQQQRLFMRRHPNPLGNRTVDVDGTLPLPTRRQAAHAAARGGLLHHEHHAAWADFILEQQTHHVPLENRRHTHPQAARLIDIYRDQDALPTLADAPRERRRSVDMEVADVCLDDIEIRGLAPSMYQAPPTAYQPDETGEEPLQRQRRFVQEKLATLHAMKLRLKAVPSDSFSTQLVLNREAVDRVEPSEGGLLPLHGVESLMLEFLSASDLLTCALVCRRWGVLCCHDGLWEKFLLSPVERYPLRALLSCPEPIPAIQVYMIFYTSGLANGPLFGHALDAVDDLDVSVPPLSTASMENLRTFETTSVASVHLSRMHLPRAKRVDKMFNPTSLDKGESLKTWLPQHAPLSPLMLQSLCYQLLQACLALDRAGLKHTDISPKNIVLHPTPDGCIPLLQLDGHYCIEKADSAAVRGTDEQEEASFWTIMYDPRNREGARPQCKNMLCGFLYCVLDLCLEGRFANLRLHSLMNCMNLDRQHMPRGTIFDFSHMK